MSATKAGLRPDVRYAIQISLSWPTCSGRYVIYSLVAGLGEAKILAVHTAGTLEEARKYVAPGMVRVPLDDDERPTTVERWIDARPSATTAPVS
jgi:hypothetical protein